MFWCTKKQKTKKKPKTKQNKTKTEQKQKQNKNQNFFLGLSNQTLFFNIIRYTQLIKTHQKIKQK